MDDIEPKLLTPQERLALSRRALVRQLNGGHDQPSYDEPYDGWPDAHAQAAAAQGTAKGVHAERTAHAPLPWVSMARRMTERWWRRHPAHAMGQLARPVLERYARKEPAKLMAIAAAAGAVLVLVKPWRLLSFTAVLAAVLKTSDVADVVNTLMQQKNTSPRKDPR
jgi:hypothetical protein